MYYYSNLSGVGFSFGSIFKAVGKAASTIIGGGAAKAGPVIVQAAPSLPPTTPVATWNDPPRGDLIAGVPNTALLIGGVALALFLSRRR